MPSIACENDARRNDAPGMESDDAIDHPHMKEQAELRQYITKRNRRKVYLEKHPEYFSSGLELADPIAYERLIRRFQTAAEREDEGRAKGFTGLLEADMRLYEAKLDAVARSDVERIDGQSSAAAEGLEDEVDTKADGEERFRQLMTWRFVRGDDSDFDYAQVDENEEHDGEEDRRDHEELYFEGESPGIAVAEDHVTGETGIQDF